LTGTTFDAKRWQGLGISWFNHSSYGSQELRDGGRTLEIGTAHLGAFAQTGTSRGEPQREIWPDEIPDEVLEEIADRIGDYILEGLLQSSLPRPLASIVPFGHTSLSHSHPSMPRKRPNSSGHSCYFGSRDP
jgi:hypothetical protein